MPTKLKNHGLIDGEEESTVDSETSYFNNLQYITQLDSIAILLNKKD
jgi:hypothetical protein